MCDDKPKEKGFTLTRVGQEKNRCIKKMLNKGNNPIKKAKQKGANQLKRFPYSTTCIEIFNSQG